MYKAYSESTVLLLKKKSIKVLYNILPSDSTFFKLLSHIFAAITEAHHSRVQVFCIPS